MKAGKGQLDQLLAQPEPGTRFYLFHGPDEAGSRALALRLLKGLGNAEKFIVLGQAVKADPAALGDEAGAMALFGGPRALWIEPAGDEIADGVAALLDAPATESAVIALAGTLRKTSSLLKLAETHPLALSHVSYVPEGRDMERVVVDLGRSVGLRVSSEVAQRIALLAGRNQAIVASELEKYALFLGASPDSPAELDHDTIDQLGVDGADSDWQALGDLALAGNMGALLDQLTRLPTGAEAIPVLRGVQRRLMMLSPLRARIEAGERIDAVMTSMGKALFWKDKPIVQRMLSNWSAAQIAEAADRAATTERALMLSNSPPEAALGETLVTLARVGARSRAR